MSIKQQATNSVIWSAIERFSVQGIQYLLSIIIARLLLPSDYGLIAMLGFFIAIPQAFMDGGFANALIQKKNRTEVDYSTVFYFNIVVSALLYFALYFCSPYIADFYDEPRLTMITKVVGLTMIINAFGIVQQAKLTVELNFKSQAMASLIAVVVSGAVGVWLAYNGYGVWTLVWHSLLNNLLRVLMMWFFAHWVPLLVFSRESFRTLFAFGSKLMISSLLHTIYTNMYTLVIGKKFASAELGFYNRAATLAQFPSANFTNVIARAIYPIQCRIQDDNEQLNHLFVIYLRMACYVIFPIMIGMCALAEPLVRLLLTDKWLPAVPMLQVLCIAYMWEPVMKINHNMLNVKGRSDYFLHAEIIKKVIAVVILVSTIPFGILVMCAGLILYSFADMIIIIYFTRKITGITLRTQLKELLPVILLSFSTGVVAFVPTLVLESAVLQLVAGFVAGGAYFVMVSWVFRFKEFSRLISVVRRQ